MSSAKHHRFRERSIALQGRTKVFVGIDQTGAATKNGSAAKALPVAIVDARSKRPRLITSAEDGAPLWLDTFSDSSLSRTLSRAGLPGVHAGSSSLAILADCVFGLPAEAWPEGAPPGSATLWSLFREAARDDETRAGYGLKPAAKFFAEALLRSSYRGSEPHPVRCCERLAKANSVFRTHPYQKNIQCGTYRIWRDLGRATEAWVKIRWFEPQATALDERPWLFEAYPSLIWRELFNLRTRDLTRVHDAIEAAFAHFELPLNLDETIEGSADRTDAIVLALGGWWLNQEGKLFAPSPLPRLSLGREGWIVGLDTESARQKLNRD